MRPGGRNRRRSAPQGIDSPGHRAGRRPRTGLARSKRLNVAPPEVERVGDDDVSVALPEKRDPEAEGVEAHVGALSVIRAPGASSGPLNAFRQHPISDLAHRTGRRDDARAVDAPPPAAVEPRVSPRDADRVGERRQDRPDPLPRLAGHPPAERVELVRHLYILCRPGRESRDGRTDAAGRCGRLQARGSNAEKGQPPTTFVDLVGGNVGEPRRTETPVVLPKAHRSGAKGGALERDRHTPAHEPTRADGRT